MKYFGKKLREKRLESGLIQDKLAEKCGVTKSYISSLELGKLHSTTGAQIRLLPDKLEIIAKALNWDLLDASFTAFLMDLDYLSEKELKDVAEYIAFKEWQKKISKIFCKY